MAELERVVREVRLQYVDKAKRDIASCLASFKDLHPTADSFTFSDGVSPSKDSRADQRRGGARMAELERVVREVRLQYVDKAKRDIASCLASFKDLHPNADSFTFSDGVQRRVVALSGTIPVRYSGSTYNIPVCVYLLETHPHHPPVVYVRPTQDMVVKPSQHVDTSGRVYLPYLSEWTHPNCNLEALVQILAMIFQESCPVFSKASAGGGSTQSSQSSLPYPSQGPVSMPQPGGARAQTGSFSFGQPAPTAYPPYPAQQTPYPYQAQASSTSSGSSGAGQTGTIGPEAIRASVISALEEKVRGRLRDVVGSRLAEVESVRGTRAELEKGRGRLAALLASLRSEEAELASAAQDYEAKSRQMAAQLQGLKPTEELDLDSAIEAQSVLHRQLLNAFVEDAALEDAIYHLGQALARGRLDLDAFLRQVRALSRQQFTARATLIKCRQKAKLPV